MDKSNVVHIAKAYDEYYGNGLYDGRYPSANPNVTDRILAHTAPLGGAARVLDYGCGSGRYLQQVLKHTEAHAYGFDVSDVAIFQAGTRLRPYRFRFSLFRSRETLQQAIQHSGKVDVALLLFGVLAHIEGKEARLEVLTWLFQHIKPGHGHLLISVPNRLRRFVWRQLKNRCRHVCEKTDGIHYERGKGSHKVALFYHLYSCKELINELERVGFVIRRAKPESLFPEKWVIRHAWLARIDKALCYALPVWLGYGILIEARRPL